MATYLEKKREAIGFEFPPVDPSTAVSEFDIPANMGQMLGNGYITNFNKPLEEQIDEQAKLKMVLEIKWGDEYVADRKNAKKNLRKLSEYLSENDDAKIAQLFLQQPVADWLNLIFLDETEISNLTDLVKKTSSKCKGAISAAIGKELERLVNFKTFMEKMLKEVLQ